MVPQRFTGARPAGVIFVAVVVADQVTKAAARAAECGVVVCLTENRELFGGIGRSGVPVAAVSMVGLAVFWALVAHAGRRSPHTLIVGAVGSAGIVANLLDRLVHGAVWDLLVLPGVAVVNLADLAIAGSLLWCARTAWRRSRALGSEGCPSRRRGRAGAAGPETDTEERKEVKS